MIETHTFENLKVDEVYPFFKFPKDSLALTCFIVVNDTLFEIKAVRNNENVNWVYHSEFIGNRKKNITFLINNNNELCLKPYKDIENLSIRYRYETL
jgi:hypothetical protein